VPGHRAAGFRDPGHRLRAEGLAGGIEVVEALLGELSQPRGKRLAELLKPRWLRIGGYWYPRGGMPIDVFWQTGKIPPGTWVPDQGVPAYRGRG
jgi:hypothetical protein